MFLPRLRRQSSQPSADPYNLFPLVPSVAASNDIFPDWDNPNGKVAVDPALVPGQSTLVLVIAGQSLSTNCVPSPHTPTNALVHNFSITNGGCYKAQGTLLGCTGYHPNLPGNPWPTGHWGCDLGDKLINAGVCQRVILVPIGVGGSKMQDWAVGRANNDRIIVTARRLAKAGLTPSAFLWEQGESDTSPQTSQADYQTFFASMMTTIRAVWSTVPVFVAKSTFINGISNATIRTAQAAVVNNAAGIFAGPDADTLTGSSFRQTDQTHWNAGGADGVAGLWQTALHAGGVF